MVRQTYRKVTVVLDITIVMASSVAQVTVSSKYWCTLKGCVCIARVVLWKKAIWQSWSLICASSNTLRGQLGNHGHISRFILYPLLYSAEALLPRKCSCSEFSSIFGCLLRVPNTDEKNWNRTTTTLIFLVNGSLQILTTKPVITGRLKSINEGGGKQGPSPRWTDTYENITFSFLSRTDGK